MGALCVFDVTNRERFENLENWIKEVWNYNGIGVIPLVLLGTKTDLRDQHPDSITDDMAQRYCQKLSEQTKQNGFEVKYFPTSALNGLNISESFDYLGQTYFDYLDRNKFGTRNRNRKADSVRLSPAVRKQLEKKAGIVKQPEYSHFLKITQIKVLLKEYVNNPISSGAIHNIRSKLEVYSVELATNASNIANQQKRETMELEDILESLKKSKITQNTQLEKYRYSSTSINQTIELFSNRIGEDVTNTLRGLLEVITLAISKKLSEEIENETEKITEEDIDKVWNDFKKNSNSYVESILIIN